MKQRNTLKESCGQKLGKHELKWALLLGSPEMMPKSSTALALESSPLSLRHTSSSVVIRPRNGPQVKPRLHCCLQFSLATDDRTQRLVGGFRSSLSTMILNANFEIQRQTMKGGVVSLPRAAPSLPRSSVVTERRRTAILEHQIFAVRSSILKHL